jgi:hypothetical protein
MIPALNAIIDAYDEIIFFVADKPHLYNRGLLTALSWRDLHDGDDKAPLFSTENSLSEIVKERANWLEKIKAQLGSKGSRVGWKIRSAGEVCDSIAFDIHRRLTILAIVDDKLRWDIHSAAAEYLSGKQLPEPMASELSQRYIIEELTLSVRLKVVEQIYDEFYVGSSLAPMLELFRNGYSASPWELAAVPEDRDARFRFFDSVTDTGSWQETTRNPLSAGR